MHVCFHDACIHNACIYIPMILDPDACVYDAGMNDAFVYPLSLTLIHVSIMRGFFVNDKRTDRQGDSRSWRDIQKNCNIFPKNKGGSKSVWRISKKSFDLLRRGLPNLLVSSRCKCQNPLKTVEARREGIFKIRYSN